MNVDGVRALVAMLLTDRCTNCFRPLEHGRYWCGHNVGPFCRECWNMLHDALVAPPPGAK
jgi:hypothetical protein